MIKKLSPVIERAAAKDAAEGAEKKLSPVIERNLLDQKRRDFVGARSAKTTSARSDEVIEGSAKTVALCAPASPAPRAQDCWVGSSRVD